MKEHEQLLREARSAIQGTLDGVDLSHIEYDEYETPTGSVDILYAYDAVNLRDVLTKLNELLKD